MTQKQADNRYKNYIKPGNESAFSGRGKDHSDLLKAGAAEQYDADQQSFFHEFE